MQKAEKTEIKTYRLGGRTYEQRPLVLGQIRQLEEQLKDIPWTTALTASDLLRLFGALLPQLAAIVLRPRVPWPLSLMYEPKRKNVPRLARRLATELDLTTSYEVVADFFVCNPVQSFLGRLTGVLSETGALQTKTAPNKPASSSPEATSPSATLSCGDTPRPSAAPTSATDNATSFSAKPFCTSSE